MLTRYIQAAMGSASYKVMEDGTYFGEITGLPGIWANEATVEECRIVLQEVLEDWLLLKLRDNDPIPQIGNVNLTTKAA
jgi:predicted RNase H-like HicB family nuclease